MSRTIQLAVLVFQGLNACGLPTTSPEVSGGYRALVEAAGPFRPFEVRLSGNFAHSLYLAESPSRPPGFGDPRFRAWIEAEDRIRREAALDPTGLRIAALGVVQLLHGRLDEAVATLDEALRMEPGHPAIQNDLAAAVWVRGKHENRLREMIRALSILEESESPIEAAAFNRALMLTTLRLDLLALRSWSRLGGSRSAAWREESAARLTSLRRRYRAQHRLMTALTSPARMDGLASALPDANCQQIREVLDREVLPRWGRERLEGRGLAEETLKQAGRLAERIARKQKDNMYLDAVEQIRAEASPSRLQTLAEMYRDYGRAHALMMQGRLGAAREVWGKLQIQLAAQGSPLSLWARFHLSNTDFRDSHYTHALASLETLAADLESDRYPTLSARVLWLKGLIELLTGRPLRSLRAYQQSLRLYEKTFETENAAFLQLLLSEAHAVLGREEEAWRHRWAALRSRSELLTPIRMHVVVASIADELRSNRDFSAAALFQSEVVEIARRTPDPLSLYDALLWQADLLFRAGNSEEAVEKLSDVRLIDRRLAEKFERGQAKAAMLEAEIKLGEDPARVASDLEPVIRFYQERANYALLPEAYLIRSQAYSEMGELPSAERDLRAATSLLLGQSERLNRRDREFFLERHREATDRIVDFLIRKRNKVEEALDLVESLPREELSLESLHQTSASAWRRRLPTGTAVVRYSLVRGQLYAWVADRTHISVTPLDSAAALETVAQLRESVKASSEAGAAAALERAFDALVRPLLDRLSAASELVFVAEEPFRSLPFSAFLDGESGRYLIQEFAVTTSPSAGRFVEAASPRRDSTAVGKLLIVADPAFRKDLFPGLERLPRAADESRAIFRLFPRSLVLNGNEATRAAIEEALGAGEAFHFAGHAVANPGSGTGSQLVLSPREEGDLGVVHARDLAKMRLGHLRFATLSACSSARGDDAGGFSSVATSLLNAGVPVVIGTLWSVDDEVLLGLFQDFYRRLRQGLTPLGAWRQLQRQKIQENAPLIEWASLQAIGRGAEDSANSGGRQ